MNGYIGLYSTKGSPKREACKDRELITQDYVQHIKSSKIWFEHLAATFTHHKHLGKTWENYIFWLKKLNCTFF